MNDIDLDAEVVTTPFVHESQEQENTQLAVVSPLDLPVATFQAGLDRRGANRAALIKWVRSSLVEGIDFGRIETKRGPSKPSLWKPGAEKICGMLGVSVHFPTIKDYENAAVSGVAIDTIILRCELRDGAGKALAEGVGARSVAKEYGDTNKALKMAEKSAHIDATLRLAGLSEVFTQDLEDMNLEATLEASIDKVREEKAAAERDANLANLSEGTREVLEIARKNREREQAKLDARPTDRQKLENAGLIDPEAPDVCEGCGEKLKRGGPVKKPGSKYLGRYFMACPSKDTKVRHTWRAL